MSGIAELVDWRSIMSPLTLFRPSPSRLTLFRPPPSRLTLFRPSPTSAPDPAGPPAAPPGPTSAYRHDLDGLRGVAIALVAIFNVGLGRVSGGVDVFLVLSGFFFGS
jgi:hypothetical protein